jgi:hypothetical protein
MSTSPQRRYGTNTDIEDREEVEDRLRLVINTTPAMLHSARPDGCIDFFNKRWLESEARFRPVVDSAPVMIWTSRRPPMLPCRRY